MLTFFTYLFSLFRRSSACMMGHRVAVFQLPPGRLAGTAIHSVYSEHGGVTLLVSSLRYFYFIHSLLFSFFQLRDREPRYRPGLGTRATFRKSVAHIWRTPDVVGRHCCLSICVNDGA